MAHDRNALLGPCQYVGPEFHDASFDDSHRFDTDSAGVGHFILVLPEIFEMREIESRKVRRKE